MAEPDNQSNLMLTDLPELDQYYFWSCNAVLGCGCCRGRSEEKVVGVRGTLRQAEIKGVNWQRFYPWLCMLHVNRAVRSMPTIEEMEEMIRSANEKEVDRRP